MKKISLMVLVFFLFAPAAFSNRGLSVNVEYGMPSELKTQALGLDFIFNDPGGLGVGASYASPMADNMELILGGTYYQPRTIKRGYVEGLGFNVTDGTYSYLPVYARLKLNSSGSDSDMKLFCGGDLRYAFMGISGKSFNGITINNDIGYGFFGGIEISNIALEVGYIIQNSSWSSSGEAVPMSNTQTYVKGSIYL